MKIGKELLDQSVERGKKRVAGRLKRQNETGMRRKKGRFFFSFKVVSFAHTLQSSRSENGLSTPQ